MASRNQRVPSSSSNWRSRPTKRRKPTPRRWGRTRSSSATRRQRSFSTNSMSKRPQTLRALRAYGARSTSGGLRCQADRRRSKKARSRRGDWRLRARFPDQARLLQRNESRLSFRPRASLSSGDDRLADNVFADRVQHMVVKITDNRLATLGSQKVDPTKKRATARRGAPLDRRDESRISDCARRPVGRGPHEADARQCTGTMDGSDY